MARVAPEKRKSLPPATRQISREPLREMAMRSKKGDLVKEAKAFCEDWLKTHYPICYPQERWDIAVSKKSRKILFDFLWKVFGDLSKAYGVLKEDFEKMVWGVLESKKILPYKDRGERFLEEIRSELSHKVREIHDARRVEVKESLDKAENTDAGQVFIDIEAIKTDVRELRERGFTIREISEITGISKSTVQRMLKKK